jgi:hypothetical protein
VELPARRVTAECHWKQLDLTPVQSQAIGELYKSGTISDTLYGTNTKDQDEAAVVLAGHRLDFESTDEFDSRWSVKWFKVTGKGEEKQ